MEWTADFDGDCGYLYDFGKAVAHLTSGSRTEIIRALLTDKEQDAIRVGIVALGEKWYQGDGALMEPLPGDVGRAATIRNLLGAT